MGDDREDLMNAADAARSLGISRTRVLELAQAGRMGVRYGPYFLFTPEEIEAYRAVRSQNKGGRPRKHAQPKPGNGSDHIERAPRIARRLHL